MKQRFKRIDLVGGADRRIEDRFRFQQPATRRGAAGGIDVAEDVVPKMRQGRRPGKDAADPDNRYRFAIIHSQAAPCSLLRWKL